MASRCRSARSLIRRRSVRASAATSFGGTSRPVPAGIVSGIAPAVDRQPVRDRFRKRHPISLETRREHKYVGCQIQFVDTLRWDGAEHRDPVAETVGGDVGVEPPSGGQVAGPVTSDGQPPGQVGNRSGGRSQQDART